MPSGACGGRAPTTRFKGLPGACCGRRRAPPTCPPMSFSTSPSWPEPQGSPHPLLLLSPVPLISAARIRPSFQGRSSTVSPRAQTSHLPHTLTGSRPPCPPAPRRGERGLLSAHPHTGSRERTSHDHRSSPGRRGVTLTPQGGELPEAPGSWHRRGQGQALALCSGERPTVQGRHSPSCKHRVTGHRVTY